MNIEAETIFKIKFSKLNKEINVRKLQTELLKHIIEPMLQISKKGIKSGDSNLLPLKPITIENRRKEGITHTTPLFKTGELVKSLYANTKGIKSKVNYAKIHYDGTPNRRPPKREYITYRSQGEGWGPLTGNPIKVYKEYNKLFVKLLKNKLKESTK